MSASTPGGPLFLVGGLLTGCFGVVRTGTGAGLVLVLAGRTVSGAGAGSGAGVGSGEGCEAAKTTTGIDAALAGCDEKTCTGIDAATLLGSVGAVVASRVTGAVCVGALGQRR
jgi:hypothetical protein